MGLDGPLSVGPTIYVTGSPALSSICGAYGSGLVLHAAGPVAMSLVGVVREHSPLALEHAHYCCGATMEAAVRCVRQQGFRVS